MGQLIPILLMGQLGGAHRSDFWVRDAGELRGWLVAANKSQLIYGSTGREMVCIALDAATGKPSEFIGKLLERDPLLTWRRLELLIAE